MVADERAFKPKRVRKLVEEYEKYLPKGCWANWQVGFSSFLFHFAQLFGKMFKNYCYSHQLGNHDNHRVASRVGAENVNLANALNLLLGGTAVVYYGEEIGMQVIN